MNERMEMIKCETSIDESPPYQLDSIQDCIGFFVESSINNRVFVAVNQIYELFREFSFIFHSVREIIGVFGKKVNKKRRSFYASPFN
jgi:hypothetical protein